MSIERSIRMAACLVTLAGASAFGQSAKPDAAPLRGPSGNDHSVPGETGRFGGGASGDKKERAAQQPIRHPMFMKALDVLRAEQADAAVRLTSDQDAKIKAIDEAFRKQAEAFRTEHAAEVRGLVVPKRLEESPVRNAKSRTEVDDDDATLAVVIVVLPAVMLLTRRFAFGWQRQLQRGPVIGGLFTPAELLNNEGVKHGLWPP